MAGNAILVLAVLFVGMMIIPAYAESSPREQLRDGISINQIQCGEEKTLIQSATGKPACVFDATLERLLVRGWSIIQVEPIPEPQVVLDTPSDQPAEEHSPEDDIMYLLARGHITTKYAPKLPDPDAVWFPMPLADAEVVLQRLLDAYDDRIVFYEQPNDYCHTLGTCRVPNSTGIFQPSLEFTGRYFYATEKGGEVVLQKKHGSFDIDAPQVIRRIEYTIPEHIPHDQREEFITSFMDRAGFYNSYIGGHLSERFVVYGGMDPVDVYDSVVFSSKKAGTEISFSGWTNNAKSLAASFLSNSELERRAYEFARKHMHLIKPEHCEIFREEPLSGRVFNGFTYAGTSFTSISIGHCVAMNSSHLMLVNVENLEGEIVFFDRPQWLVDDWYEKVDTPKYALTHLQSKMQEQPVTAKPIPAIKPITVTSTEDLLESHYHENGNLLDEKWYHESGNPKTQKKYNLFGNGNLERETHYHDDYNGFIKSDKEWNDNGQLSSEGEWHENGKTKFRRTWHDNGQLSYEIIWTYDENWKPHFLSKLYYENGNLNVESKKVASTNYENRMMKKYYARYYEDGELYYERHYDDRGKRI